MKSHVHLAIVGCVMLGILGRLPYGLANAWHRGNTYLRIVRLLIVEPGSGYALETDANNSISRDGTSYGELILRAIRNRNIPVPLMTNGKCQAYWVTPRGQMVLLAAARASAEPRTILKLARCADRRSLNAMLAILIDSYASRADAESLSAVVELVDGERRGDRVLPTSIKGVVSTFLAAGNKASEQGEWANAAAWYEEVLRYKPDDPVAVARLGWALFNQGFEVEALRSFQQAVLQHPESSAGWMYLGAYYLRKDAYPDAEPLLSRAVNLSPELLWPHVMLATVWLHQGRCHEARDEMLALSPRYPQDAAVLLVLGDAFWCIGDYSHARVAYSQFIAFEPQYAGQLQSRLKDTERPSR